MMNNQFSSATPEQKLSVLANELRTPTEIIRGLAFLIKKDIEGNKVEVASILSDINKITEAAEKIKKILDEVV